MADKNEYDEIMNEELCSQENGTEKVLPTQEQKAGDSVEHRLDRLEGLMEKAIARLSEPPSKRTRVESDSDELDTPEESFEQPDNLQIDESGWLTDNDDEDEGPEINKNVAMYIDTKLLKRLPRDQMRTKLERQKKPKNVVHAKETRVNPPIYNRMSKFAKQRDGAIKSIQGFVIKAVIAMSKVASVVIKASKNEEKKAADEWAQEIYTDVFDAITLACQASFSLNMRRVSEH